MVFSDKSPNQPKEAMSWRKYWKKVIEAIGNKDCWLIEEMKSLNDSSTRIELLQMLISVGPQSIEEELPSRNWSSLIVYSSLRKRSEYAIILGEIELKKW